MPRQPINRYVARTRPSRLSPFEAGGLPEDDGLEEEEESDPDLHLGVDGELDAWEAEAWRQFLDSRAEEEEEDQRPWRPRQ